MPKAKTIVKKPLKKPNPKKVSLTFEKEFLQTLSTHLANTTKEILSLTKKAKQLKTQLTKTKATKTSKNAPKKLPVLKTLEAAFNMTTTELKKAKKSQLKLKALQKNIKKFEKEWALKEAKQRKLDTMKEKQLIAKKTTIQKRKKTNLIVEDYKNFDAANHSAKDVNAQSILEVSNEESMHF